MPDGTNNSDIIIPGFNSADTGLPTLFADVIRGFGGNDLLNGWGGPDNVLGGDGDDILLGDADGDNLTGDAGDDTLFGDAGDDNLTGDAGDDRLLGGTGADNLNGGDGSDTLLGETGGDGLDGGAGGDYLVGGDGADVLRGGGDNDTFIYNVGAESDFVNTDTILDFQGAGNRAGDRIDLSNIDVNSLTPLVDDDFTWNPDGWGLGLLGGTVGELGTVAVAGGIELRGDTDGVAGTAELVIELTGVSALTVVPSLGTDIFV